MRALKALSLLALVALPAAAIAGPATLKGQMKFVSDAPVEKIVGSADGAAALDINLQDLTKITGKITVPVASMKTGNDIRDDHLKSDQWLDAKAHPEIVFEVASVVAEPVQTKGEVKSAELKVTGKFTLHGVTTDLTAPATIKWKGNKVKISTKFNIKLADYKVKGKEGIVGQKVGETIACEATLKGVAQ
jgi:polyisoprenoid-binding protein YceI